MEKEVNKTKLKSSINSITIYGWIAIAMVVIASFLRLYNIRGALQFQGDQGRDVILVSQIFRDFDPVFIGPVTSVGNMYLGPLYYYFMLPFLMMSYPDPAGPSYAVAILGIITVGLMYYLGKKMIGPRAAVITTTLFTFSAIVVRYTRFSWNPNPAPLISLLMIFFTYQAWKKHPGYWILVSLCFSILIQLHYLILLSAAGAGIIWLVHFVQALKSKKKDKRDKITALISATLISVFVFLASLTPLLLFDYKHNGQNLNAFKNMLSKEENFKQTTDITFTEKITTTLKETEGRAMHILFEYNIGKNRELNRGLVIATIGLILYIITRPITHKLISKNKFSSKYQKGYIVISAYLFTGILGTSFYQHTIFDHYISYLFPVTFLVFGIILSWLMKTKPGAVLSLALMSLFIWHNMQRMPFQSMGWTIDNIKETSDVIYDHVTPGEKYNIILLSESGDHYGQNYRYFLTTKETRPLKWENAPEADTLFIIDEAKTGEDVVSSPVYDIAAFPNREPYDVFETPNDGPIITVLKKQHDIE